MQNTHNYFALKFPTTRECEFINSTRYRSLTRRVYYNVLINGPLSSHNDCTYVTLHSSRYSMRDTRACMNRFEVDDIPESIREHQRQVRTGYVLLLGVIPIWICRVNNYTKGQVIYKFLTLGDLASGLRKPLQNSPEIVPYDRYAAACPYTIRRRVSSARILCPPREAPARTRY